VAPAGTTPSPHALLAFVAEQYDARERPVTAVDAAAAFDTSMECVSRLFRRLRDCELLAAVEGGYRPTVTGREYLALDIDDGTVIVDPQDDC